MLRVGTVLSALLMVFLVVPAPPVGAQEAATVPTTLYPMVLDNLTPPVAGRPNEVDVVLASGDTRLPGRQVTLWVKEYGASTFSAVGHATTDVDGLATTSLTLIHSATVHWTFDGDGAAYDPTTSPDYLVQIAPRVGIRVNDRTLRRGQRLVVRGHTFPAKAGCAVKLWRGELRPLVPGPKPVRLAVSTVRADGSYRLVRRFHRTGRVRVAVTVSSCAGNARGLSSYVGIRLR